VRHIHTHSTPCIHTHSTPCNGAIRGHHHASSQSVLSVTSSAVEALALVWRCSPRVEHGRHSSCNVVPMTGPDLPTKMSGKDTQLQPWNGQSGAVFREWSMQLQLELVGRTDKSGSSLWMHL